MTTVSDLSSLPTPAVIETLSFETIFGELQAEFQTRYPDYSALLASDPAIKLLEVAAYREVLLRNRINAAAKASLLAFATGSDLDHLATFYGVTRLPGEDDEALRARTRQRIIGFANAGGAMRRSGLCVMICVALPACRPGDRGPKRVWCWFLAQ